MTTISFSLLYNGVEQSFAAWGLARVRRVLRSQQTSTVQFTAEGRAADAAPLFPYGTLVTIYRTVTVDNVPVKTVWFFGAVTETPASGSGRAEAQAYTISDPWWYLENLTYQATWVLPSYVGVPAEDIHRSHCFLNPWILVNVGPGNSYWARRQTDWQINDVFSWIAYAAAQTGQSYPLQLGGSIPAMDIPIEEVRDVTCAEVIRKQLRWMPDAVTWFDYTTTPPTLRIARRASLVPVSMAFGGGPGVSPVTEVEIRPRYDLQVPAVAVKFEEISQVNKQSWLDLTSQIYPPSATGYEQRALVLTVALQGLSASTVSNTLVVQAPDLTTTDPTASAWWRSKLPWLANPNIDGASIAGIGWQTGGGYGQELVSGQITSWMANGGVAIVGQESIIIATVKYNIWSATPHGTGSVILETPTQQVSVKITETNAPLGANTYTTYSSVITAEQVPATLAADLYAGVGLLHYEGTATWTEEDCSGLVGLGNLFNLTGSAVSAWGTMNAIVQTVTEDLDTGETRVTFGPPAHLHATDLVTLLQLNRYRVVYNNPALQSQSALVDNPETDLGTNMTIENSAAAVTKRDALVVGVPGDGNGSVSLIKTGTGGHDLVPMTVQICVSGVVKNLDLIGYGPY